ncbi:MAG: methylmalonyl-CoA epimerase [Candidatus Bathyarchaeota archaeon]
MFSKIDHIGIAVRNLDETAKIYREILGLEVGKVEESKKYKVRVVFIPIGDSNIELMETTDPEGPIGKFITRKGEGIHHVALRTKNIERILQKMRKKRIHLIDEKPKRGIHKSRIAFLHPKSFGGVLLELYEKN